MPVVDELIARLGLRIDPQAAAGFAFFRRQIQSIKTTATIAMAGMAAQLGVVSVAFNKFITEANELQTLSDKTGVATDSLQEWTYVAQQAGVSADALKNDLISITKSMASPIPGQLNMGMMMFGVSVRKANGELKTSDEILSDMADKLSVMSPQRAQQWGSKIGLSADTVVALRQGSDALEKLKKQARDFGGVIPEAAIKQAVLYQQKLNDLKWAFRGLTTSLAIGVLPIFNQVIDVFRLWIVLNKEWLALRTTAMIEGLYRTFVTLKQAFDALMLSAKPITKAIEGVTGSFTDSSTWGHLFLGVILSLTGKLIPFILRITKLTAVITAVSYAAEDLFMLFTGGNSAIGKLLDNLFTRFPKLKSQLIDLKNIGSTLFDNLKRQFATFSEGALPVISSVISKLSELFAAFAQGVLGMVIDRLRRVNDFLSNFTSRYPNIVSALQALAHFFGTILAGSIDLAVTALEKFFSLITSIKSITFDALEHSLDFINQKLGDWFFNRPPDNKSTDTQNVVPEFRGSIGVNNGNGITAGNPSSTGNIKGNSGNDAKSFWEKAFGPAQFIPPQPARQSLPISAFPSRDRQERPQIIDNRTINQTITTSDPKRAADLVIEGINSSEELQTSTPGMFAPTVG